MKAEPVGLKEIAERLGVKQQTAAVWRYRGILPAPKWTVSGLPAWDWPDIKAWSENRSGRGISKGGVSQQVSESLETVTPAR